MKPSHRLGRSTGGFTLVEMVVAISIVTALVAVVIPSVLQHVGRGEATRVAKDLKTVAEAAKFFNSNVQRWPATLNALAVRVTSATTDLYGYTIPDDLAARWNGPYLDRGGSVSSGLTTGYSATIENTLELSPWNGTDFLVVRVSNLQPADAAKVDELVDGVVNNAEGQVRHDGATTLRLFAMPVVRP